MDPAALDCSRLGSELRAELRSDHAGEVGAVMIYRGILAVTRDPKVQAFARSHQAAEEQHLAFFEALLPPHERSRLLPLWRLSGWVLGAVAALAGPTAVYATVAAVERFVVEHYEAQIEMLERTPELAGLRAQLLAFQGDEADHLADAGSRAPDPPRTQSRVWSFWRWVVDRGSRGAVLAAKRF